MSIVLLIICALVLLYLGTSQTTAIVSLLGAGLLGVALDGGSSGSLMAAAALLA